MYPGGDDFIKKSIASGTTGSAGASMYVQQSMLQLLDMPNADVCMGEVASLRADMTSRAPLRFEVEFGVWIVGVSIRCQLWWSSRRRLTSPMTAPVRAGGAKGTETCVLVMHTDVCEMVKSLPLRKDSASRWSLACGATSTRIRCRLRCTLKCAESAKSLR